MKLHDLQRLKDEGKIRGFIDKMNSVPQTKRSKYGNKKTVLDGITFDSQKEATRYMELRMLLSVKEIRDLQMQVEFKLEVNGKKVASYYADFTYWKDGEMVVEDVKSRFTKGLAVYRLKKKLMLQVHGIEIKEV